MKLCIDCKWCTAVNGKYVCSHPQNTSLVDGRPNQSCAGLRAMWIHGCTSKGYWFESKENENNR